MRQDYDVVEKYATYDSKYISGLPHCVTPNGYIYGVYYNENGAESLVQSVNGWDTVMVKCSLPANAGKVVSMYAVSDTIILIGTISGKIFRSMSPFSSVSLIFTMATSGAYAQNWSWASKGSLVFVGEYGFKDTTNNARRVYKSTDSGATFTETYQIPQVADTHVHKLLLDPYTDILWISNGDSVAGRALRKLEPPNYNVATTVFTTIQPTWGIAYQDYILWVQDSNPYGVYKHNKADDTLELVLNLSTLYPTYADTAYCAYADADGTFYFTTNPDSLPTRSAIVLKSVAPHTTWELVTIIDSIGKRAGIPNIITNNSKGLLCILTLASGKIPIYIRKWNKNLRV
jgi:hypothetical protein